MVVDKDGKRLQFGTSPKKRFKKRFKKKLADLRLTKHDATLADLMAPHQLRYEYRGKTKDENFSINCDVLMGVVEKCLAGFKVDEKTMKEVVKTAKDRMKKMGKSYAQDKKIKQMALSNAQNHLDEFVESTLSHVGSYDEKQKEVFNNKRARLEFTILAIKEKIAEIDTNKRNIQYEAVKFIEILNDALSVYQESDYVRKRYISKVLFTNIVVSDENTVEIRVNPILDKG